MLDDDILIDAGTGAGDLTLSQMLGIHTVFLTHSHLDHTALLPMLADAVGPRRDTSLDVYALPETIATLKQNVFNFKLWPDYTALPSLDKPYVRFHPVEVGYPVELSGRRITPLPVRHAVPAVAYQFDSGNASFVFSGDTTYHEPFWESLNAINNLRYLMIEATFLNHNITGAEFSGHMRPQLLAQGLRKLNKPVRLLVTHMEPGNEDATMAEIQTAAGEFRPEKLRRGQVFEF
ncbi:Beta-lactamase superfamily domain-containing protein [Nitrosovibrio tenuis]|uniref:Beta-lactamase superfamily domain-containing protein n=2 Tax=Nitrosovibrio tenuis TaxID=1233 RepID=A0A1H7PHK0_9PROT|nr:Beta-lactamase superfamily domain-containing protein [Nitrosovibrio tenuis]